MTAFPKTNANAKPATKADVAKAEKAVSAAIASMVLGSSADQAFYACLIMETPRVFDQSVGTACMGRTTMTINPHFVNSLPRQQVVFLLAHELMHKVLHHIGRLGSRNPRAANVAMDAVINDILVAGKVGEMIPNGISQPGARGSTWEQLYQEPPDGDDGHGQGDGDYGIGDDIDTTPMSPAESKEMEQEVRIAVNNAARAAKARGVASSGLARLIDEIIAAETPWQDKLRHLLTQLTKGDYTWARPNRRFISGGLYLPSIGQIPTMGTAVIALDTSGSISQQVLTGFLAEINKIMEDIIPEKVQLIYFDHEAYVGEQFGPDDYPITMGDIKPQGGGGTSFVDALAKAEEFEPDVCVVLTDGYGDQESCEPAPFPVVWASTDKLDGYTFGDVIKIK